MKHGLSFKQIVTIKYRMKILTQTIGLILITSIMYAQDIEGKWKGALSIQGTEISIILHVDKINNQYETILESPDQNGNEIKVTTTNFNYPKITLEISSLGAVYEGIMSDKSITGKWIQSGTALFLAFLKVENSPKEN
jgi:hypothetical protein